MAVETASERRTRARLSSVELWSIAGGVAALVTAMTTVGAVLVGLRQLDEARAIQREQAAYEGFAQLQQVSLDHPELVCPNDEDKFGALMADPTSRARYSAYGLLVINNSEQLERMAPGDPRWEIVVRERMRCHAPAIRFLMREGSYERRYSCRMRRIIAEELKTPPPTCAD